MKFLRDELMETVSLLKEKWDLGYYHVLYSEKQELYAASDFKAVTLYREGAVKLAQDLELKCEYIPELYDRIEWISRRDDLAEVVRIAEVFDIRETEIKTVLDELKAAGLYESYLEPLLREKVESRFETAPIEVTREIAGRAVVFQPYLLLSRGKVELLGYAVQTPDKDAVLYTYFPLHVPLSESARLTINPEAVKKLNHEALDLPSQYKLIMNRNNLEQLRDTLKAHNFGDHLIKKMEEYMEKDLPAFQLRDQIHTDKGQMDLTMSFRQSAKSDFYYFNNYKLDLSKGKPLENGYQYTVTSPNPEANGPKNLIRRFDSPVEAIKFFDQQTGNAELGTGKKDGSKHIEGATIATMKEGKVDYVAKEFYGLYRTPPVSNTFYLRNDKTFNLEQGVNLMQGRAVFRDDLLNRGGEQYSAWVQLDFDQKKDSYGNYKTRQFSEGYGFELKKELDKYEIKELYQKESAEKLTAALENGSRPVVTVMGPDGEHKDLRIEAVPKYGNINFFDLNGKPEKRENFLSAEALQKESGKEKSKDKEKSKESAQDLSM